jgi:sec-independent protein translocase protein TatA
MFPKLGMGELVVILIIVVVLFGASKLPQLGAGLGEGIRSFKRAMGGEDDKPSSTASTPPSDTNKPA